ncbi:MAG: redoxin domain-containing protein [Chloroflexi bacterium]|nr:redoxin domain-containing protein [Chloroflexota bacterium]
MLGSLLNGQTGKPRIKLTALAVALMGLVYLAAACGSSDPVETTPPSDAQNQPLSVNIVAPTQERESATVAGVASNSATDNVSRKVGGEVGDLAPEFGGIEAWINGGPLTMEELRGQVVLIDFWTYTCINCIRTYPYLKQWHSRYADDGLVIVGVHAPEFEFEKVYDNVVEATEVNALDWTMAQDNDFVTWRRYSNRFWPAKYLIDKDGVVRYTHFGEGGYAETEDLIRELLAEADPAFLANSMPLPEDQAIDPGFLIARNAEVTRELYGGYERGEGDLLYGQGGYVQQMQYFENKNQVFEFTISESQLPHKINFQGAWHIGPESSTHGRMTESYEDYLSLVYSATSVNAVLTSDSGEPYKVRITVDGEYLTDANKGSDIIIGDDGESYLWVRSPSLYNVINNDSYVRRQNLKMASNSPDFGLFAFTFGVYDTGP